MLLVVELLLVLRVEPTSLRKREFMDEDDIYEGDIIASGGGRASSSSRSECRCGRRTDRLRRVAAAVGGERASSEGLCWIAAAPRLDRLAGQAGRRRARGGDGASAVGTREE